jgi:uncharacterized protein HemY
VKSSKKIKQLTVVVLVLVLGVILFNMPIVPSSKLEIVNKESTKDEQRLAQAIAMVQGEKPMQGITILREMLQENPENVDVIWHLGHFSIQSGQYEKAIERFKQIVALDVEHYADAYFYLGRTYATLNDSANAIASFERYQTLISDTIVKDGVDRFINELKKN